MTNVKPLTASTLSRAGTVLLVALALGTPTYLGAGGIPPLSGEETLLDARSQPEDGVRAGGATWVESAAGVDLGVVKFGFRGERPEWNLGIGRALGLAPSDRWSFVGAGLSVTRPLKDQAFAPTGTSPLDGVEVKPWVGGCVNCPLGEIAQLGLELQWAPGSAALLGDEDTGPEGSLGISLDVQW